MASLKYGIRSHQDGLNNHRNIGEISFTRMCDDVKVEAAVPGSRGSPQQLLHMLHLVPLDQLLWVLETQQQQHRHIFIFIFIFSVIDRVFAEPEVTFKNMLVDVV